MIPSISRTVYWFIVAMVLMNAVVVVLRYIIDGHSFFLLLHIVLAGYFFGLLGGWQTFRTVERLFPNNSAVNPASAERKAGEKGGGE